MTQARSRRESDFQQLPKLGGVFHDYRAELMETKCLHAFQIQRNLTEALDAAELYATAYHQGQEELRSVLQWSTVQAMSTPKKPRITEKYDSFTYSKDGTVVLVRTHIVSSKTGYGIIEFYILSWV
jgi:hypothetical protein